MTYPLFRHAPQVMIPYRVDQSPRGDFALHRGHWSVSTSRPLAADATALAVSGEAVANAVGVGFAVILGPELTA